MHEFDVLVRYCTEFSLRALEKAEHKVQRALQRRAATNLVVGYQMLQMQKVILVVGMFSMFDANLQDRFQCSEGFQEAMKLLNKQGKIALRDRFYDLQLAINVLKHGRGRSYDELVKKVGMLPFRVKLPEEYYFDEGNVSEVSTLVEVDDVFVRKCVDVICEVSSALSDRVYRSGSDDMPS